MHAYMHAYIHTYIFTYLHTYMNAYIHTNIIHTNMHMYIHISVYVCIYTHLHKYVHTYIYIYIRIHIDIRIYIYIYVYTYMLIYLCIVCATSLGQDKETHSQSRPFRAPSSPLPPLESSLGVRRAETLEAIPRPRQITLDIQQLIDLISRASGFRRPFWRCWNLGDWGPCKRALKLGHVP